MAYATADDLASAIIEIANQFGGEPTATLSGALQKLVANGARVANQALLGAVEQVTQIDATTLNGAIQSILTTANANGNGLADQQAAIAFTALTNNVQDLATSASAIAGVTATVDLGTGHIDALTLAHDGAVIRNVNTSIPAIRAGFIAGNPGGIVGAVNELINTGVGLATGAPPTTGGIDVEFLFG